MHEIEELEALNHNTLRNLHVLCAEGNNAVRWSLISQGLGWADHILEGPRSWILSLLYILLTVVSGYTPLSLIVLSIYYGTTGEFKWGAEWSTPHSDPIKYVVGFVDAIIYAFLPWWTTVLLRLVQGRSWHHRVAGRSLLIGDVPWVAQSLEAFTSKLFALSYSIASVNVASGNPLDHLVHRHTHRVVRGALLAVGRPDGRADALTSAENTVCLSVNQASSIQNMGVTLESITVGHNPFKLGLSANAIFLPDTRPHFFSEWVRGQKKGNGSSASSTMAQLSADFTSKDSLGTASDRDYKSCQASASMASSGWRKNAAFSTSSRDSPLAPRRSSFGSLSTARCSRSPFGSPSAARSGSSSGLPIDMKTPQRSLVATHLNDITAKENMTVSRHFASIATKRAQEQKYLGEWMASDATLKGESIQTWMEHQSTMQCLYEGRMASLERFVSFLVLFHSMGKRVQDWWPSVSCGLLGYDMSRSHSIMRIATTASPVSGADVRAKMIELADKTAGITAERIIGNQIRMHVKRKKEVAYKAYKAGLAGADLTTTSNNLTI